MGGKSLFHMNQQVAEAAGSIVLRCVLLLRRATKVARHKFFIFYLQMTTRASDMRNTYRILVGNTMKGMNHFGVEVSKGELFKIR